MKAIRIISGILALLQIGWAAGLGAIALAGAAVPLWAAITGAIVGAVGTAAPGVLEKMVEP